MPLARAGTAAAPTEQLVGAVGTMLTVPWPWLGKMEKKKRYQLAWEGVEEGRGCRFPGVMGVAPRGGSRVSLECRAGLLGG